MPENQDHIQQILRVKIRDPFDPKEITVYSGDEVHYEIDENPEGTYLCVKDYPEVFGGQPSHYIEPGKRRLKLVVAGSLEEGKRFKAQARRHENCPDEEVEMRGKEGGGKVGGGG